MYVTSPALFADDTVNYLIFLALAAMTHQVSDAYVVLVKELITNWDRVAVHAILCSRLIKIRTRPCTCDTGC